MKKSPLKEVNDRFQNRQNLIKELAEKMKPAEGKTKDQLRQSLGGMSNKKLLNTYGRLDTGKE